jgi:hypothetical protein
VNKGRETILADVNTASKESRVSFAEPFELSAWIRKEFPEGERRFGRFCGILD